MTETQGSQPVPPVVVVGASAGGVEALRDLVALLPLGLRAAVLVVLHMPPDAPSALPVILRRAGRLPVHHAEAGSELRAGEVIVARPDHHLVVVDGVVTLSRGPQENGHRPAVDVLFRSAARARGPRVLGVVLSGTLDDGAAGAVAIDAAGGEVVVQSFDEALYDGMPRATARAVPSAGELEIRRLASTVATWAEEWDSRPDDRDTPRVEPAWDLRMEVAVAKMEPEAMHDPQRPGDPSGFGCPDCSGALFEIAEGGLVRYRCRIGHAWSAESLLARQAVDLEGALWMALRSLEEKAALSNELGGRADDKGHARTAARFRESAQEALGAAELLRQLITEIGERVHAPDPGDQTIGT